MPERQPRFTTTLHEVREQSGLTVETLAEHCQVSPETIELIEQAKYEPSVVLAERIAEALGVTPQSLFTVAPPAPKSYPVREERIDPAVARAGHYCFRALMVAGMLGSVYLCEFSPYNDIGLVLLCSIAAIGIAYVIMVSRIPGYQSYSVVENTRAQSRKRRVVSVVLRSLGLGVIISLIHASDSITGRVVYGFVSALLWGPIIYWSRYSVFMLGLKSEAAAAERKYPKRV